MKALVTSIIEDANGSDLIMACKLCPDGYVIQYTIPYVNQLLMTRSDGCQFGNTSSLLHWFKSLTPSPTLAVTCYGTVEADNGTVLTSAHLEVQP